MILTKDSPEVLPTDYMVHIFVSWTVWSSLH